MKSLIGKFVKDKETGKSCKVLNATDNSIEIFKTKNEDFYKKEVKCTECERTAILEKSEKFKCSTRLEIVIEGEKRIVNCRGKAIEVKKHFTGIDSSNWHEKSWFERKFEIIK
jgi:hypothetical protein